MTTLNVKGMLSQKDETKSLIKCLDARASWGCAPVAIAQEALHQVGLLVILDVKRHGGQKQDLEEVIYAS